MNKQEQKAYVEKKAEKFDEIVASVGSLRAGTMNDPTERCKDLVRQIIRDCQSKVKMAFIWKMVDDSVFILHQERAEFYKKKFTEAGVEVEE